MRAPMTAYSATPPECIEVAYRCVTSAWIVLPDENARSAFWMTSAAETGCGPVTRETPGRPTSTTAAITAATAAVNAVATMK